jgi:hypothetical protein
MQLHLRHRIQPLQQIYLLGVLAILQILKTKQMRQSFTLLPIGGNILEIRMRYGLIRFQPVFDVIGQDLVDEVHQLLLRVVFAQHELPWIGLYLWQFVVEMFLMLVQVEVFLWGSAEYLDDLYQLFLRTVSWKNRLEG